MTLPKKPSLQSRYAVNPVIYWLSVAVMLVIATLILVDAVAILVRIFQW